MSGSIQTLIVVGTILLGQAAFAQTPSEINDSVRLDTTNGTTISWDDLPGLYLGGNPGTRWHGVR
jgi:hypothetical protein